MPTSRFIFWPSSLFFSPQSIGCHNNNSLLLLLFSMWSPFSLLMLAGLTCCCYVNDKPYHLMQQTECRGGKIYEINDVQDIDECKAACLHRNCRAVNLFQIGEFRFKCEILAYVYGYFPAQGAACYVSYY